MNNSSSLLIDEHPLTVQPSLAVALGLHRAMFVQQLHYWLRKRGAHIKDGRRWVYNTYEEWHEQFPFWKPETIRKLVKSLEETGVILTTTEYNHDARNRTKWYSIDYEALNQLIGDEEGGPDDLPDGPEKVPDQPENRTGSQPENRTGSIYTETTNRDSDLQSGETGKTAGPPTEKKLQTVKQYAVKELMDRVKAARQLGNSPHPLPDRDRAQYAAFFEQASRDGHEVETLLLALDYLVAKASGKVENEPKAWAGFGTALDRVLDGWRPRSSSAGLSDAEREKIAAENAENQRLLAEVLANV